MGLNDLFDRFRQPAAPEAEQRKTTMQLLEDERFLDFLDDVEAQTGRRVFQGNSLDAPASDELLEYHGRYLDQKRVADQVANGVALEFKEAGLVLDKNLVLPASTPYVDRYNEFFFGAIPSTMQLPPNLAQFFEKVKMEEAPDLTGNHPNGVSGEDAAAQVLTEAVAGEREHIARAKAEIEKLKAAVALPPVNFSNPADFTAVSADLQKCIDAQNAYVGTAGLPTELLDVVTEYFSGLQTLLNETKAALVDPPSADTADVLTTKLMELERNVPMARFAAMEDILSDFDAAVTEKFLAKETMGSRLDTIREEVAKQAIADPAAFDLLKERMARLEVKDRQVQELRRQIEQNGLGEPDSTNRLRDMQRSLKVVDKYGSGQPLLGKIRRLISPRYRNAANQLEEQFKFSADSDRQTIKNQLAHVEELLQAPSGFQRALQEAEGISAGIKADIPTLQGFGDTVRVALQESLKAKLAKGDLAGISQARGQVENVRYATLINDGVDIDVMKNEIEAASMTVFKKNLLEQLEAKGGKNITTILRGFENLAAKLHATKSIESQNLLDFVKQCLADVANDLTLSLRTRQYGELIRNTVEARYA